MLSTPDFTKIMTVSYTKHPIPSFSYIIILRNIHQKIQQCLFFIKILYRNKIHDFWFNGRLEDFNITCPIRAGRGGGLTLPRTSTHNIMGPTRVAMEFVISFMFSLCSSWNKINLYFESICNIINGSTKEFQTNLLQFGQDNVQDI